MRTRSARPGQYVITGGSGRILSADRDYVSVSPIRIAVKTPPACMRSRSTARRGEAASGRERAAVGALEGVAAAVHILVNVRVKQGYLEGRIASLPVNIKEAEQADMNATSLTGKEYEGK